MSEILRNFVSSNNDVRLFDITGGNFFNPDTI